MKMLKVESARDTADERRSKRERLRELETLFYPLPKKMRKHIARFIYEAEQLRESAAIRRRLAVLR